MTQGLTAIVGFVDRENDLLQRGGGAARRASSGRLSQDLPAQLRRLRRGPLLLAAGGRPLVCELRRRADRRQHLRGHLVSGRAARAGRLWPAAQLVINISASPYHAGKVRSRERMLATRAADNVVMVAYCNLVGGQDELVFDGGSADLRRSGRSDRPRPAVRGGPRGGRPGPGGGVSPSGCTTRAGARNGRPGRRRTSNAPVERAGARHPSCRRPGQPSSCCRRSSRPLEPVAEVYQALVLGTRDYVRKNGFRQVVIGLSGGIDSSLTAAVAADALGRGQRDRRVHALAVLLVEDSREDAERAGRQPGHPVHDRPDRRHLPGLPGDAGAGLRGHCRAT